MANVNLAKNQKTSDEDNLRRAVSCATREADHPGSFLMLEYQKSSAARMVHLAGRFRQFKVTTHHCSIHRYSKTLANQHICAVAGFGG